MKALTICQPYAELIARGDKLVENRTWSTDYRGPLAIHAGKSREWGTDEELQGLVFGAIVATVTLVDCIYIAAVPVEQFTEHVNGPWCWMLADVRRLAVPVPYRGARLLWDLPDGVI